MPDTNAANPTDTFDAIVIGSGMGGLTTASLLSQLGNKRVLVIERHAKLGGFTHSFQREKYEWDVGVHYVGEMKAGTLARRIMDLVTRKGVQWHPMGSPYERIIFPTGTFDVPVGAKAYEARLIEKFPAERKNIKKYFKDVSRAHLWIALWYTSKQYPPAIEKLLVHVGKKLAGTLTGDYLARFSDPLLRAILAAQWPNFGTPPHKSSFAQHATVAAHFFDGGFYPIGGSKEIAKHAAAAVTENGGVCLVSHDVTEILVKDGSACGVKVRRKGKDLVFHAPMIISDAGVRTTFEKLVPPGVCAKEKEQVARLEPGTSAVILFVGLKDDPRKHGFNTNNYWMYRRLDHDTEAAAREGEPERIDGAYVSFGSLRNPGQTPHTAQVISFGKSAPWQQFADGEWMRRGEEYAERKRRLSDELLDFVEERLPGFRDMVAYSELSTPLTIEHFANHKDGLVYGQLCDPNRLFRDRWSIDTSLPNLFLTGSDVGSPGVDGAMMAGVMAAGRLLGSHGMPLIMTKAYLG